MVPAHAERLLRHFVQEDAVLRAYVYAATRSHQDSDDILQEVWRTLTLKLDQYDDSRPFRPWALGVARIQVLRWRQARGRDRLVAAPDVLELLADTAVEQADSLDVRLSFLELCLEQLTDACRRMLRLKYAEGLRAADVAARVGRNVAAVEMTLVRARRELRACMEDHMRREFAGGLPAGRMAQ